jgi:hypothetical protein
MGEGLSERKKYETQELRKGKYKILHGEVFGRKFFQLS